MVTTKKTFDEDTNDIKTYSSESTGFTSIGMASHPTINLGLGPDTFSPLDGSHVLYCAITLILICSTYALTNSGSKVREINPRNRFEFTDKRRIGEYMQNSKDLMLQGKSKFDNEPWSVCSEWGNVIVLPPEFLHELRSHPSLTFSEAARDDSHAYVPGFDPFDGNLNLPKVIMKHLKKATDKLVNSISEEATLVIRQVFTDSAEWHSTLPKEDVFQIISRLSTRVFMGKDLCRDDAWIQASSRYTGLAFPAGWDLGQWPRWSRPIVHWFLPSCWEVRKSLAEARKVLQSHLDRRNAIKAEALASGDTGFTFGDSIEWFEQEYTEKFDPASEQILLSLVAIHTTSDLLQQTMIDLACHPELFAPLREELVQVLRSEELQKTALHCLKLMDSVVKESQRMKPVFLSTFRRKATGDIKLSNGFLIRKGQKLIVANTHMWDSKYYENPERYDGYRFLSMRSTDEKNAQLVSTSISHPGFGHGQHACPGRFFAANEIKIALAHLLLKYEWKLPQGFDPKPVSHGMNLLPDPSTTLLIRRRKEEFDIDSLIL